MDKNEESDIHICWDWTTLQREEKKNFPTHLELNPALTLFGISAGAIPFPEHNPSPRNVYQCLEQNEPVLLSNGERKAIKHIRIGDEVITFDPSSLILSSTRVSAVLVSPCTKICVRVRALSGDITVTADHLFFARRQGKHLWIAAGNLRCSDEAFVFCHGKLVLQSVNVEKAESVLFIADITTESTNHSFVGGSGSFCVHNSAMGKQAIGAPPPNFHDRMPTKTNTLNYAQKPLVTTLSNELIDFEHEAAGQVCQTGIASLFGFDQEVNVLGGNSHLHGTTPTVESDSKTLQRTVVLQDCVSTMRTDLTNIEVDLENFPVNSNIQTFFREK